MSRLSEQPPHRSQIHTNESSNEIETASKSSCYIDHKKSLVNDLTKLLETSENADVIFRVYGNNNNILGNGDNSNPPSSSNDNNNNRVQPTFKRFKAHRIILASRSAYFKALLFSEFQEKTQIKDFATGEGGNNRTNQDINEIKICDLGNIDTFDDILKYCYTGSLDLSQFSESHSIDILCTAHQFGINELVTSIMNYLLETKTVQVYAALLNVSLYLQLDNLRSLDSGSRIDSSNKDQILNLLDQNAQKLLSDHDTFSQLSTEAVKLLLDRSSFYAKEKSIFDALVTWRNGELGSQVSDSEFLDVKKLVRFELMDREDFFACRRSTIFVDPNILLDRLESMTVGETAQNSSQNSSQNSHQNSIQNSTQNSAQISSQNSNQNSDQNSNRNSNQNSNQNYSQSSRSLNNSPHNNNSRGPRGVCIPNVDLATEEYDAQALQNYGECAYRLIKKNENSLSNRAGGGPPVQSIDNRSEYQRSTTNQYTMNFVNDINRGTAGGGGSVHSNAMLNNSNHRMQGLPQNLIHENGNYYPGQQCARHLIPNDETASQSSIHSYNSSTSTGILNNTIVPQRPESCLILKLGKPSFVNWIKMNLWVDRNDSNSNCWYTYKLESSIDGISYKPIVDYENYICQDTQLLYIPTTVIHFLKIAGKSSRMNRYFSVARMEIRYNTNTVNYKSVNNVVVPKFNIANSAILRLGVTHDRKELFTNSNDYDWDNGYTCHQIGSPEAQNSILLQFPQPYQLSSFRLRLWDLDTRRYSYNVEVSVDNENWEMVANRTTLDVQRKVFLEDNEENGIEKETVVNEKMLIVCNSWQVVRFAARPVVFVRITGTRNTANEVFHLVYFEAPATQKVAGIDSGGNFESGNTGNASYIHSHENVEYVISGVNGVRRSDSHESLGEAGSSLDGASFGDSTNAVQSLPVPTEAGSNTSQRSRSNSPRHESGETIQPTENEEDEVYPFNEDPIEIHRMKTPIKPENLSWDQKVQLGMLPTKTD